MFGFTKVERETYNSTFLRKVIISIKFPSTSLLKQNASEIKEIFKQDFPRATLGKNQGFQISIGGKEGQPNLKTIEENDNISLKSEDGQIELLINYDSIIFSIDGNKYTNYENNVSFIFKSIKLLLNLLSVSEIVNCSIRKINLIEFNYNEHIPNGILNALLNKTIVYNEDAFNGFEYITQNIHNLEFKDANYKLNLKYGMNTLPVPDKKIGQLIVDNEISFDSYFGLNELEEKIRTLNEELFNVFHWIFNDDAKKILRNGDVK